MWMFQERKVQGETTTDQGGGKALQHLVQTSITQMIQVRDT